jgi:hypothetical protein
MREARFFGHLSPTTGLVADRLSSSGYRAVVYAENLALNASIAEAEQSLMDSIGHRRNILSEEVSRVGVGAARKVDERGIESWYLTQVFAAPVEALDEVMARSKLLDRVGARRAELGVGGLRVDEELEVLAGRWAEKALEPDLALESLPEMIANEASELARARVGISVHAGYHVDEIDLPAALDDGDFQRVALGMARDTEDSRGKTVLIMILADQVP